MAQWTDIRKNIFPPGFVWLSTEPTSPASLFGGTWIAIQKPALLQLGKNTDTIKVCENLDFKLQTKNLPKIGWEKTHMSSGYNALGFYSIHTDSWSPNALTTSVLESSPNLYWGSSLTSPEVPATVFHISYGTSSSEQVDFLPPCYEVFCWQRIQ